MKRTPIARSAPLRVRTGLRRKVPMRRRSERNRRRQRARRTAIAELVDAHGPWCQARLPGCTGHATTAHEPLLRSRGGDPTDPSQMVLVCWACHDWIHRNPAEATRLGLMKSKHSDG